MLYFDDNLFTGGAQFCGMDLSNRRTGHGDPINIGQGVVDMVGDHMLYFLKWGWWSGILQLL